MTVASSSGPVDASARVAKRDPFFDNAKLVLIVLVVVGHNWYPATGHSQALKAAYLVVYTFHMPAFALLTGYFSRRFSGSPAEVRKLAGNVIVPYVIFETLYALLGAWLSGQPFTLHLSSPIYVTWFLLSLFVWRLTSPLWRALRHPVVVAFVVSLVAGITVVDTGFALSRTLQLLPWFVLGMQARPEHFAFLRRLPVRLAALPVFLGGAVIAWFLAPSTDLRWFDREYPASDLGVDVVRFLGTEVVLDAATVVLIAAALAVIPAQRSWITALGAFTMYPFLLHGLITRLAQHAGVHDSFIQDGTIGLVALTLLAVALALALASPPVRVATSWLVEPAVRLRRSIPALAR